MWTLARTSRAALLILGLAFLPASALAQIDSVPLPGPGVRAGMDPLDESVFENRIDGPRVGMGFAAGRDPVSQFGWHFERHVAPDSRGPWFVIQTVVLASGSETGRFVPSVSMILGVRLKDGYEFGVGPSLSAGGSQTGTGVVLAVGRTFRVGAVRVPLNLAMVTRKEGDPRFSLLTGWAIRTKPS